MRRPLSSVSYREAPPPQTGACSPPAERQTSFDEMIAIALETELRA